MSFRLAHVCGSEEKPVQAHDTRTQVQYLFELFAPLGYLAALKGRSLAQNNNNNKNRAPLGTQNDQIDKHED